MAFKTARQLIGRILLGLALSALASSAFAADGREACNDDRKKICNTTDRDKCDLNQHLGELSEACKTRVLRLQKEEEEAKAKKSASGKDDSGLSGREACQRDRTRICAASTDCKLADHLDELSPKCRERQARIRKPKDGAAQSDAADGDGSDPQ